MHMSHKKCGSVAREDWPKMSNLIRSSPFTLPFGTNYSDFKNLVQNKNCVPIFFMDGLYIGVFSILSIKISISFVYLMLDLEIRLNEIKEYTYPLESHWNLKFLISNISCPKPSHEQILIILLLLFEIRIDTGCRSQD